MIDLANETPLRVNAAAELLNVSRRTIQVWFDRGLEHTKLGRTLFTTREALQRFSAQETPETPKRGRPKKSPDILKELERYGI
ncbi:MAG: helix-turn-helix domain-containing protein [Pirellulales bacterium]